MISEERILQVSNDISEDMCQASARELVEVVKYFRDKFDDLWEQTQMLRMKVGEALIQTSIKLSKVVEQQSQSRCRILHQQHSHRQPGRKKSR